MALDQIHTLTQREPLHRAAVEGQALVGQTVAQILAAQNLDPAYGLPLVVLSRQGSDGIWQGHVLPMTMWATTCPKIGTRVEIAYAKAGDPISLIAMGGAALLPTAGTWIGGTLLGLGAVGTALVSAAVTVVGSLLLSALIPTPEQGDTPEALRAITGSGNRATPFEIVPQIFGRRRVSPPLSATGYTETVGDDIYFVGLFCLGYGPVAVSEIQIGETPITEFEGWSVDFRGVDANLSDLPSGGDNGGFNFYPADSALPLYRTDITTDSFGDEFRDRDEEAVRRTRVNTGLAQIDIDWPRGLFDVDDDDGDINRQEVEFRLYWRKVGENGWNEVIPTVNGGQYGRDPSEVSSEDIDDFGRVRESTRGMLGTGNLNGKFLLRRREQDGFRVTQTILFPEKAQYEIRVRRLSSKDNGQGDTDAFTLSAIRSYSGEALKNHPEVAEMSIRLKSTDQLSGQLDDVNLVVNRLALAWDGTDTYRTTSSHPAWAFLTLIHDICCPDPVPRSGIDLDGLLAYAAAEPHWTCDLILDRDQQIREAARTIAATGRATLSFFDFKHGLIPDQAAGPIKGLITPRNSWGFSGEITIPKPIHGFRVIFWSEFVATEDEVIIYADGYNAGNATEFETLRLPGVIVRDEQDATLGNVYRLARYHLAQAKLRRERFSVSMDWEHMAFERCDKVRLIHDVPIIGLGQGRVKSITQEVGYTALTLDDQMVDTPGQYRWTVRVQQPGEGHAELVVTTAELMAGGEWRVYSAPPAFSAIKAGDLLTIEETEEESLDCLIYDIIPRDANQTAELVLVPAAPAVLSADTGTIPDYVPVVGRATRRYGRPPAPRVVAAFSGRSAAVLITPTTLQPRIGVSLDYPDVVESDRVQLRWRRQDAVTWQDGGYTAPARAVYTDVLERRVVYSVQVRVVDVTTGKSSQWVNAGAITSISTDAPPPGVTNFSVVPADQQAIIGWDRSTAKDLSHMEVRFSSSEDPSWGASSIVDRIPASTNSLTVPARPGTYFARWVDYSGRYSNAAASYVLLPDAITASNVVATSTFEGPWTGTLDGTEVNGDGDLVLSTVDGEYVPYGTWEQNGAIDLGAVYPVQVTLTVEAFAFSASAAMSQWVSLASVTSLTSGSADDWSVTVQIAISDDGLTYSDWVEFTAGGFSGRYFKFRAVLRSFNANVTPQVLSVQVALDMPDRVDGATDVSAPISGVTVNFAPPFREAPAVVVTPRNTPSGARVEITGKTRTGFTAQFFDSSDAAIAADFDWVARGYGREKT